MHGPYKRHIRSMYLRWLPSDIGSMNSSVTEHPFFDEVTTEDMVKKMHDSVLADSRVKIREIADFVDNLN